MGVDHVRHAGVGCRHRLAAVGKRERERREVDHQRDHSGSDELGVGEPAGSQGAVTVLRVLVLDIAQCVDVVGKALRHERG